MSTSEPPFPPLTKAVLPAAGLGTRLRPLTRAFPKELLPIGRAPVLAHIAAELMDAGITDALFIVSERKPQIRTYFGDVYTDPPEASGESCRARSLRCDYVVQQEQRGLGDALLYAEAWAGAEPFVVAFGDCLIESPEALSPLQRLMATHRTQGAAATVLVETVDWDKVSRYGVLAPESPQSATSILPFSAHDVVEKPAREQAPSNRVVAARWILTPAIFPMLRGLAPDARGEINLTDAVRQLRAAGGALWAVPLLAGEARRDIGNFESFFTSFIRAALRDPEYGEATARALRTELEQERGT